LHREERHAAGSLGDHHVALADVGFDQCAPRRHTGAGNGRGFDIAEVIGRANQARRVGDAVLLQPPVFAVAGQLPFGFRCGRPIEPIRMKRPHDTLSGLQPTYAWPDCDDLAGAVTQRHAWQRPGDEAHQIDVVMEVEARGLDLDQHLPGTGLLDRPVRHLHGHAGPVHDHDTLSVRSAHAMPVSSRGGLTPKPCSAGRGPIVITFSDGAADMQVSPNGDSFTLPR